MSGWYSALCLRRTLWSVYHGCPAPTSSPVPWLGPQSLHLRGRNFAEQFCWSVSHRVQGRQFLVSSSIWSNRRSLLIRLRSYFRGIRCFQLYLHGMGLSLRHRIELGVLSLSYLPRAAYLLTQFRWSPYHSSFLENLGCLTIRIYRIYPNRLVTSTL